MKIPFLKQIYTEKCASADVRSNEQLLYFFAGPFKYASVPHQNKRQKKRGTEL